MNLIDFSKIPRWAKMIGFGLVKAGCALKDLNPQWIVGLSQTVKSFYCLCSQRLLLKVSTLNVPFVLWSIFSWRSPFSWLHLWMSKALGRVYQFFWGLLVLTGSDVGTVKKKKKNWLVDDAVPRTPACLFFLFFLKSSNGKVMAAWTLPVPLWQPAIRLHPGQHVKRCMMCEFFFFFLK